jgi:hypothetical protein
VLRVAGVSEALGNYNIYCSPPHDSFVLVDELAFVFANVKARMMGVLSDVEAVSFQATGCYECTLQDTINAIKLGTLRVL